VVPEYNRYTKNGKIHLNLAGRNRERIRVYLVGSFKGVKKTPPQKQPLVDFLIAYVV
jgi:hypothetical protein